MRLLPVLRSALAATLPVLLAHCAASQVKMDQSQLREALMDYTEDQIVDNVIRARNSMPILQIDMEQVEAVVKTSLSASTGGGRNTSTNYTRNRSHSFNLSRSGIDALGNPSSSNWSHFFDVGATVVGGVTRAFNWSASGSRDNTIDVQMNPVMDEPAVYEAYEKFVSLNGGDSVRDSLHFPVPDTKEPHPDDPDGVHVGRKWRGVYYWVPNKYRKEFFKLCLSAGVRRDARNAARKREADGLKEAGDELRRLRLY